MKTYSLAEVAEILCGDSMKLPELWVTRQIQSGRFQGYKAGRSWRMTDEQLAAAVEVLSSPRPVAGGGLSSGSARRRLVVAQ